MDCLETAAFPGQPQEEIDRLLHFVVVGGGPTGVEYSAELRDFLVDDVVKWYPFRCYRSVLRGINELCFHKVS
jgi:NADH:ubiquinone reductase (non-electrogenic)